MAKRWSTQEENSYRDELIQLYVIENKSIREIAIVLDLKESSVFQRLKRLGIPTSPSNKEGYLNKVKGLRIPTDRSCALAEFFGIMLGDGHISHTQVVVTLGTKELEYVEYVAQLMETLFWLPAKICIRPDGYRDVYLGSVVLTAWLREEGLVPNKVQAQVDVPAWIFEKEEFIRSFLRGFFDTDGSIYRLTFGKQISLTNRSLPLLHSLQRMLIKLGYKASAVGSDRVYVTRKSDVNRFFAEIKPANQKHVRRFEHISAT